MADLYAEGYGASMTDDRERTAITWGQFGHLYVPFYTFQYSIGISAAHALADQLLSGAPEAAERYMAFLCAGKSRYTLDLFELAGVDMSTSEPVERTFHILAHTIDRLQQLTGA